MGLIMTAKQCAASTSSSWRDGGPSSVGAHRQRQQDSERLLQILTMDPEVLCLTQRERA